MNRMIKTTLACAALAAASPLLAQGVAPPAPNRDAAAVQAGTYKIDTGHTLVQFSVLHFGINDYFGTFPGATGTLSIDPRNIPATKLDVTIPVAKVSTTNAKLDQELVGSDWFDAARFPEIRFVSTKVTKTGANTASVTGNLTLHGVTKPITLDATFNAAGPAPMGKGYLLGFKASGRIKRSDFGVSKYVALVSDETTLTITAAFDKQPG